MKKKGMGILLISLLLAVFLNLTAITALSAPPSGFDQVRSNIPHGTTTTITYRSKTTNSDRKAMIYTPPGYSTSQKYSVMYLLHGVGGDQNEWYNSGKPHVILDNLYSEKKLAPMIVVLPNCKAGADTSGFETFQYDLINDLIPYIDSHYPVLTGRENRAIAGLSAGGGQALNFGLKYMDYFANIGAFSPGMNTYSPSTLAPDPSQITNNIKLLWISAGDQDGALSIAQGVCDYLKKNNVPYTWYHAPGGHDWPIWKDSLYQFSQLIFKEAPKPTPTPTSTPTSTPTPTSTNTPTPTPVISIDINHDGVINMSDVVLMARAFNTTRGNAKFVEAYDLNRDGAVNMRDIVIIAAKFNTIVQS